MFWKKRTAESVDILERILRLERSNAINTENISKLYIDLGDLDRTILTICRKLDDDFADVYFKIKPTKTKKEKK